MIASVVILINIIASEYVPDVYTLEYVTDFSLEKGDRIYEI